MANTRDSVSGSVPAAAETWVAMVFQRRTSFVARWAAASDVNAASPAAPQARRHDQARR
jgi:hypothetical protein